MKTIFNYWKEIWEKKGIGDKNDLSVLDGFDACDFDFESFRRNFNLKIKIKPIDKVLEIGCGSGMISQFLDCDYYGVDYSQPLLNKHKNILGRKNLYHAEANDLSFPDNYFDIVFCYSVALYFPDKEYFYQVKNHSERLAKKIIYWGDIPHSSVRPEHLIYTDEDFIGYDKSEPLYFNAKGPRYDYIKLY